MFWGLVDTYLGREEKEEGSVTKVRVDLRSTDLYFALNN